MKVLLVDDDVETLETVKRRLVSDAHIVDAAHDGADGSFLGRSYEYDAIVLDYSLPRKNGLTVCREIRAAGRTTPIIFLSVSGDTETKLDAFKEGADDYMTKPFAISELCARLGALSRRPVAIAPRILSLHTLELDLTAQTVSRAGRPVRLTRKEHCLLEHFMRHIGIILSRAALIDHVWSADGDPLSNSVEAHIRNIRRKITAGGHPNLIINIPGRGYVMDAPEKLKRY